MMDDTPTKPDTPGAGEADAPETAAPPAEDAEADAAGATPPESETPQFQEETWDESAAYVEAPQTALEAELAAALKENAEMRDQLLRALADAENTRRRAARDKEDMAKFAITGFARDLLETADNLRRALEAVPADAKTADPVLATFIEGVEATERHMLTVFAKHGLVKIEPQGEAFDPNYHQAMFEVPNSGQAPGTVVQVMQSGYVLNGRLVRPAMVGVAKGEPPPKVDTVA